MGGARWGEESERRVGNGRGLLGKRGRDSSLGKEESWGRVSPAKGQASLRSSVGESHSRDRLTSE